MVVCGVFFRIFALNKLRFATGKPAGLAFVANIPKLKTMTIKTKLQTLIAAMMATTAIAAQQQALLQLISDTAATTHGSTDP